MVLWNPSRFFLRGTADGFFKTQSCPVKRVLFFTTPPVKQKALSLDGASDRARGGSALGFLYQKKWDMSLCKTLKFSDGLSEHQILQMISSCWRASSVLCRKLKHLGTPKHRILQECSACWFCPIFPFSPLQTTVLSIYPSQPHSKKWPLETHPMPAPRRVHMAQDGTRSPPWESLQKACQILSWSLALTSLVQTQGCF